MIHIEISDRFRTTASCLLLTSYADENLEHHVAHPMRARVLAAAGSQWKHPCAQLFREQVCAGRFGSDFYSLTAWLSPSSPFSYMVPTEELAQADLSTPMKELVAESDYPGLLTSFCQDAGLSKLWRSLEEEWAQVRDQCRAALGRYDVENWMDSFWGRSPKRLVLVPNPTDPPTFGFGPSNRTEALCIIGPPAVPKSTPEEGRNELFDYGRGDSIADLVVHEFGHTYLVQAREAITILAGQTEDVGQALELKDWFPEMYGDWTLRLQEVILRAVQAVWRAERVSRDSADAFIQEQTDRFGLAVLPSIYRLLLGRRKTGERLGPEGVVETAAAALHQSRCS